jgi:methylmalonyl-CoA decarboxylase subunit alpha
MTNNRTQWDALLTELRSREEAAAAMGGSERIARQHQRGRLTARERIEALADPGTFREYGALTGGQHPGGRPPVPADGLVAGTVRIDGRTSVVLAEDFTVQGGSIGHPNAAKRARLVRLALEQRYPLLVLLDGAGERASNQDERYPHAPVDLQLLADMQGLAPIVAIVLGTSAGHGALAAMFADLVIMAEGSSLFSAGPPLVKPPWASTPAQKNSVRPCCIPATAASPTSAAPAKLTVSPRRADSWSFWTLAAATPGASPIPRPARRAA